MSGPAPWPPDREGSAAAPALPQAAALPYEHATDPTPPPGASAPRVTVVDPPTISLAGLPKFEPGTAVEAGTPGPPMHDPGSPTDYFDWVTDNDVSESARDEEKPVRRFSMKNMSPGKLVLMLTTTFFGNVILVGLMLIPILCIHYVYRPHHPEREYKARNIEAWFIWAAFNLHLQWWIHFLVELIPAIILYVVRLIWGPPGQLLQSALEYYRAMSNYFKFLLYAALNWGSWTIIFSPMFGLYTAGDLDPDHSWASYTPRLYQVMQFIVIIKFIAIRFHQSSYADRIQSMSHTLKVLDHLYNCRPKGDSTGTSPGPRAFVQKASKGVSFLRERSRSLDGTETPRSKGTDTPRQKGARRALAKQKFSQWQQMAKGRAQKSSALASHLASIGMRDPAQLLKTAEMGLKLDMNTPAQAKKVARSIFVSYQRDPTRRYLVLEDFAPAYVKAPSEARDAFAVFDRDGNGDISQIEIKNTVLEVFKERRILAKAMHDLNDAVAQLDLILGIIACIFILFEAFAIFNVDVAKTLSTFYTMGIAFAFVFKESAQNLFDSIIFLFVTHPFDTGDLVQINQATYIVLRLNLLSTQFVTTEGLNLYMSNPVLAATSIQNFRRSSYQYEETKIQVAFDTPWEKIDAVQRDLNKWIENDVEHRFMYPARIFPSSISYMRTMELIVGMTHSHNFQDWGNRLLRKVAFMAALMYYLRKHRVVYEEGLESAAIWDQDWQQQYQSMYEEGEAAKTAEAIAKASGQTPTAPASTTLDVDTMPEPPLPNKMAIPESQAEQLSGTKPRIDWERTWVVPQPDPSFEETATSLHPHGEAASTYMYFRPPPDELSQMRLRRRHAPAEGG